MRIGVDYYPEHWDRSMWEDDARLMQKSGVSVVRMGEFAWCRMEPEDGLFAFEWLDEAISVMADHGIDVVLGTPTATPPVWLTHNHPDVLPIGADLHPMQAGVRCHRCYNSPSLARYTRRIVEQMAIRYGRNPGVIGWQTDNEFGLIQCHCPSCNVLFREWVRERYGSLSRVNAEWGTVVWSGEFSDWAQITTPLGGSPYRNPSYLLDYQRFCSDSTVRYQRLQVELLREHCPGQFITHNIWGYPVALDYQELFEPLDFVSHDYYPRPRIKEENSLYHGAMSHDLVRGIKQKPFWVMEQLSGPPGCWGPMSHTPEPGEIRAFAWQGISRGADAIVHFRWRSATVGAEQFWHGLIDHSNVPGRRFFEFQKFSREVQRLAPLIDGTRVINKVAILHSHQQQAALSIQPQSAGFDYFDTLKRPHRALTHLGAGVDVIDWSQPLDQYKLVVAPSLFLLNDEMADKLAAFAHGGGTLVLTNRTGTKHMNNQCRMQQMPGPLRGCAGVVVEEYDPVGDTIVPVVDEEKRVYQATSWCDILRCESAVPIAWYSGEFYQDTPAVTRNTYGAGAVYYLGACMDEGYYSHLFGPILESLCISRVGGLPEGVEVSVREDGEKKLLFILNLSPEAKRLQLGGAHMSALSGAKVGPDLALDPYGVEILAI